MTNKAGVLVTIATTAGTSGECKHVDMAVGESVWQQAQRHSGLVYHIYYLQKHTLYVCGRHYIDVCCHILLFGHFNIQKKVSATGNSGRFDNVGGSLSTDIRKWQGRFNFLYRPLLFFILSHFSLHTKLNFCDDGWFFGNKEHSSWPKLAATIQPLPAPTQINQAPQTSSSVGWRQRIEFSVLVSASTATGATPPSPLTWPGENLFFHWGIVPNTWMDCPLIHLSMHNSVQKPRKPGSEVANKTKSHTSYREGVDRGNGFSTNTNKRETTDQLRRNSQTIKPPIPEIHLYLHSTFIYFEVI